MSEMIGQEGVPVGLAREHSAQSLGVGWGQGASHTAPLGGPFSLSVFSTSHEFHQFSDAQF